MLTFWAAEKALATLQARPIPGLTPPVLLVLSPYPSTTPPTPLPPPSAQPRLVKHLPPGYTDSQLYDLFRPYGALASVRTQSPFGKDTGVVEYWREEDAREAEEAMHCADVEGQNIAVQVYQPRRGGAATSEFNATAPTFVPTGSVFPYPTQVSVCGVRGASRLTVVTVLPAASATLSTSLARFRAWPRSASAAGSPVGAWVYQPQWTDRSMQSLHQSAFAVTWLYVDRRS